MSLYLVRHLGNIKDQFSRKLMHRQLAPHRGLGGQCGAQNEENRDSWLEQTLARVPAGHLILDAGAGELKYKHFCTHLNYISQDFAKYDD